MSSSVGYLKVELRNILFEKRIPNLCLQIKREYEPFSDFIMGLTNNFG